MRMHERRRDELYLVAADREPRPWWSARRCSVMSPAIFDAPMALPRPSFSGDVGTALVLYEIDEPLPQTECVAYGNARTPSKTKPRHQLDSAQVTSRRQDTR